MGSYGQQVAQGLFGNTIGTVLGRAINRPLFNWTREAIPGPEDRPSAAINTQPISSSQLAAPVSNALRSFTGPGGTVNWAAAMRAGAVTPEMQAHLQTAGLWDQIQAEVRNPSAANIADQRWTDADTALNAAKEDQARANQVAGGIQSGMDANRAAIDKTSAGIEAGFRNLTTRADAAQTAANAMPGQVRKNNQAEAAAFASFQKEQMSGLQEMIQSGLQTINSEKAEALNGIASNMAADISATASAASANMRNQLSEIEGNPDMPPEAKAGIGAQVRLATSQQAGRDIAPIRRMYRELESTTRTSFANLLTQFQSASTSAVSGLQGAQQATRGGMAVAHSEQYAGALAAASKIGEGLTGIMATAEANRAMGQANLDATRVQLEATGNQLLTTILPYQSTPFLTTSEIMQSIMDENVDIATLSYNEQITNYNMRLGQVGMETGVTAQYLPAFQPRPPTPEDKSMEAAAIGAAGNVVGSIGGAWIGA